MNLPVFSVSQYIALINQTLEFAYPLVSVTGEITELSVRKNKWLYITLKDDEAALKCFGTIYHLPGPLEVGMTVEVTGQPRLHQLYGFSHQITAIRPVGEGSIKQAFELLRAKLEAEGLFDPGRKRALPQFPEHIGLITSAESAAAADFIKITSARWSGLNIRLFDVAVQGVDAPEHILAAIEHFNQIAEPPEVLVIIRGGGGAEDLAAFSTESVVRTVAASRIPTVVAIGHEVDISLAELAADLHASTPSNAAELLVPDKREVLAQLKAARQQIGKWLESSVELKSSQLNQMKQEIVQSMKSLLDSTQYELNLKQALLHALKPTNVLQRGYAIIRVAGKAIGSVDRLKAGDTASIEMRDGEASASISSITKNEAL